MQWSRHILLCIELAISVCVCARVDEDAMERRAWYNEYDESGTHYTAKLVGVSVCVSGCGCVCVYSQLVTELL